MFGAATTFLAEMAQADQNKRIGDLQRMAAEQVLASQRLRMNYRFGVVTPYSSRAIPTPDRNCRNCGANEWRACVCQYCGGE